MKMLDMDIKDIKDVSAITREEAIEFLENGVHIICRVSTREFQEIFNVQELNAIFRLVEHKIYSNLEFYIK